MTLTERVVNSPILSQKDSSVLLISISSNLRGFSAHPQLQIRCHRTQTSQLPIEGASPSGGKHPGPSPAQPLGPAGGRGRGAGPLPLRACFCRSPVPNCPLGSDPSRHGLTRSGVLSRRVKRPAAAGHWEPITAIFNLIKAVSTIDFGGFNY